MVAQGNTLFDCEDLPQGGEKDPAGPNVPKGPKRKFRWLSTVHRGRDSTGLQRITRTYALVEEVVEGTILSTIIKPWFRTFSILSPVLSRDRLKPSCLMPP